MTDQPPDQTGEISRFPIVALCASAGGLEAFQAFFEAMPVGSGMAFIVVQHQPRHQQSILGTILQRHTQIVVKAIEDGMRIQPNGIYVLPSSYEVTIWNERFQLNDFQKVSGWPNTIDQFLESLAQDQGARAIAIILSGTGTDSVKGIEAIRKNGGLVIAQNLDSAIQDTMPRNIIDANMADAILPPAHMPTYLLNIYKVDRVPTPPIEDSSVTISEDEVMQVIKRVRRITGRDFENYKTSTMRRQTARFMTNLNLNHSHEYLEYMEDHPEEADRLAQYLLINVTSFFRDYDAFESLKVNALLPMLKTMDINTIFRAWVPGCASGEEAVSIAILIYECLRELSMLEMQVRIFASDANTDLVRRGRSAFYPTSIADEVPQARLRDHFIAEENGYRVRNHISRMIIWSDHNLAEHPPFSNLHLISCRNVLIYFQKRLQDKVFSLFQFALYKGGILFLGSSETWPLSNDEFSTIDTKNKIYRRTLQSAKAWLRLDRPLFKSFSGYQETSMPIQQSKPSDSEHELRITREMLIDYYNPTSIIVDENYYVQYSFGNIDDYLRYVPGANVQRRVLEIARQGLDRDLTLALHDAFANDDDVIVRKGVWVKSNGEERIINLIVQPIRDKQLSRRLKLIIFDLKMQGNNLRDIDTITDTGEGDSNATIARLRQELKQTHDVLQSTIQALQAKSEELSTLMKEIRSVNEELQTTNEELQTSQEELETMNEELITLNSQLTDQNEQLTRINNNLHNFMESTEIAMIVLNQDLTIREYTPATSGIFNLRPGDQGRPLSEITTQLHYPNIITDIENVLDTTIALEKEILSKDDCWYNGQLRPYRTTDNIIDGIVLIFSDITTQKEAQIEAEQRANYVGQVFDTIENSLLELDEDLRVLTTNHSFYNTFKVTEENTIGQLLYDLGNGQWDIPDLRHLLTDIIPQEKIVRDYEVIHEFPDLGIRTMHLNARQIAELNRILLVIGDVSPHAD